MKCNKECELLLNDDKIRQCNSISKQKFFCSRVQGHIGDHIACGMKHELEIWRNEKEKK